MKLRTTGLLLCFCFAPFAVQAQTSSDQHPLLTAKYLIGAGAFIGSGNYKLSADGVTPGAEIDFDGSLGVDDSDASAFGSFRWRFGEKWSLRLQGFELNVKGGRALNEDIQFGDYTFKAGSNIKAGLKTTVVRAFMGRTFSTGPKHEFGAGLGLHWLQLDAFVSGEAFINDQAPSFRKESVKADLPLPNIGAWYWYAPTHRWMLTARVDWLSASVGDYSGGLWNVGVGAQFQVSDHFGIGAEYGYFDLNGDVSQSSWTGKAEISNTGPLLYMTANW